MATFNITGKTILASAVAAAKPAPAKPVVPSPFVRVSADLLHAVARELDHVASAADGHEVTLTRELLEGVVDLFMEDLNESGGCDHSVGICACSLTDVVAELRGALA